MLGKSRKYNLALATTATIIGSTVIGITAADAATFTYNLTRTSNIDRSIVILSDTFPLPRNTSTIAYLAASVGAPTLILTATNPSGGSANVALRANGVGVAGGAEAAHIGRNNNGSENLLFNFSQNVLLKSAKFARVSGNLDTNDGFGLKDSNGNPLVSVASLSPNNFYNFINSPIGSLFSFYAPQNNDTYLLQSITIETVPEFSTLWGLLGLGVLGLVWKKPITSKN